MFKVSSDPHAYLRPIYRELALDRVFALLGTDAQFDRLIAAVALDNQSKAAHLREFNHTTRVALLGHLANMESQRPMPRVVTMWTMRKHDRELCCTARYLPTGIDVALMEDGEMRRTQLVKDGPHAENLADRWKQAALDLGWSVT